MIYSPRFLGDGRFKVEEEPQHHVQNTRPLRIRRIQCRELCDMFEQRGEAISATGGTLWVLLEHARINNYKYELKRFELGGFGIRIINRGEEP